MKYLSKRGFKVCMVLFLLVLYNPFVSASAEKKKINLLVVHSFDEALPDYPRFNELIEENLNERDIAANIKVFYLDCDSYDHDGEIRRMDKFLDTVFFKPDLIVVTDDQATYSLLATKNPILKTLPIIFSGVNFPNKELLDQYPNVTGLWDYPDYEKNVKMIEDLLGVKRIRFIYDRTFNGQKVIERLADQYKGKDDRLYSSLIDFLKNKHLIENQEQAGNGYLRGDDYEERPIKTSLYFINMRDELGRNLLWNISGSFRYSVFLLTKYDYTIAKLGRLATVPTFSAVNKGFARKQDIIGGYMTTVEDLTSETAEYVARIVNGEPVSNLPIKETPKKYVVDWEVLNIWHISPNDVPKYIEIVNMPFIAKYKTETIVFSSVFMVCILSLIVYLLFLYRREAARKRLAQANLWKEKEFLSLALEGGSVSPWRYDSEEEAFVFDKEFAESVHMPSEIIKLKEMTGMTHPAEVEYAITTFINVLKGGEHRGHVRVRIDFNGKGYVWYEFRFLNISGVLGQASSVIGLLMNIQDYKNKEDELIEARDMASKAELKQSFLANMSHEIRTPLNAIVGFSNILVASEDLSNEEKVEYIQIINKNCELLLKLINDILEISRIESGNMSFSIEPCGVNDLVDDIYGMCMLQAPAGVEFIKKPSEEALIIDTDAVRLKQVLVNFINNAFKFTVAGHVTIGVDVDEAAEEVCIYVEDTGSGIPEDQQKMIFGRFYKVDEFAQGTGLGLSICQVIADKLNGRLVLSSEVGKGSRFGIVLSYAKKHGNDLPEGETPVNAESLNTDVFDEHKPVVLIAEDNVSNYMVLNNILKKYCNIIWTVNGKDALEIVKKRKIDLVLMDIKMHEMDGITALAKIRKTFKHLPVIIQTAYDFEDNRKLAKQAGASGFIAKPISPEILLNEVRRFIKIDG